MLGSTSPFDLPRRGPGEFITLHNYFSFNLLYDRMQFVFKCLTFVCEDSVSEVVPAVGPYTHAFFLHTCLDKKTLANTSKRRCLQNVHFTSMSCVWSLRKSCCDKCVACLFYMKNIKPNRANIKH